MRVGIDNGKKGAIVGIDSNYRAVLAERMPLIGKKVNYRAIWRILSALPDDAYVVLEEASTRAAQSAQSGLTTGTNYGAIQGMLIAGDIAHEIRRPQKWHKSVGIVTPKIPAGPLRTKALKAQAIAICQRRLPTLQLVPARCRVPNDGLADAGCMALDAALLRPFAVAPSQGSLL